MHSPPPHIERNRLARRDLDKWLEKWASRGSPWRDLADLLEGAVARALAREEESKRVEAVDHGPGTPNP